MSGVLVSRIPKSRLTAMQQYYDLMHSSPCKGEGDVKRGKLTWNFAVQPTPLSRVYKLKLTYQQEGIPKVYVIDPDLSELAGGRPLPHVYEQKPTRLCLYLPRAKEWTSGMKLSNTLVSWAVLWLFYYEEWLVSNEWKGGGEHPKKRNAEKANSFD